LGHLSALTITDIYSYLTQRNDPTSCAILVGVSASNIGTKDPYILKALSIHIQSLLPGTDLEIPIEIQTSAIIGVGLLYTKSSDRFMNELLFSELTRLPDDNLKNREAYALAAGISIGLVNLGNNINFEI
jgi:anaphase-promoting complex subunit 1